MAAIRFPTVARSKMTRHHIMMVLTVLLMLVVGSTTAWVSSDAVKATCTTDAECGCTDDCLE